MDMQEEIAKCDEIAVELLSKYESADEVPAWVVKQAVMDKFGFVEGSHEMLVMDLVDDVFTMMHEG